MSDRCGYLGVQGLLDGCAWIAPFSFHRRKGDKQVGPHTFISKLYPQYLRAYYQKNL